jgi:hypothetical protein
MLPHERLALLLHLMDSSDGRRRMSRQARGESTGMLVFSVNKFLPKIRYH